MPTKFLFGSAWYPEQWPEARWAEDLKLMRRAGMNVVRVAEFAWSKLEPSEGKFDLEWLDRAIRLAEAHQITVVIGTPTASPPAWLTQKYPEVLRVSGSGQREGHGARAHASFISATYRRLCRRIVEQLAKKFGRDPNVVGWQVDNEYSLISSAPDTRIAWQAWLKQRHGSLDRLNDHWTTNYWSQTYSRWNQIPLPGYSNPGLALDFKRFVTDTWTSYQRNQIDVLRPLTTKPITTNYMMSFDGFDHNTTAADLDVASVDYYVASERVKASSGAFLDVIRGLRQQNFWVTETQVGRVDFAEVNSGHEPGETRTQTWQSIGHGADMISYWQWRSALNGQEQYYGTVLGPDGTPRPIFEEVAKIGRELEQAGPSLMGTNPSADVAILYSWPNRWAVNGQRHHKAFDYGRLWELFHTAFRSQLTAIDAIDPAHVAAKYKVIVAPALHIEDKAVAAALISWVKEGGHLVVGPRSGVKDEFNRFLTSKQPGMLSDWMGAVVEEFYPLLNPVVVSGPNGAGKAEIWAESLLPIQKDVDTLWRYGSEHGWLSGKPAAVTRAVGAGRITYVGCWPNPELLLKLAAWAMAGRVDNHGIKAIPADVEVARRESRNHEMYIIINHHPKDTRTIDLSLPLTNVMNGQSVQSQITVRPRDVMVMRRERR